MTEPSESEEDDADVLELMLLTTPAEAAIENPETARFRQTLSSHTQEILQEIDRIARALNLDPDLHGALVHAAQRHDRGKDRPCWQYYAWNEDGSEPVAKSTRYRDPRRALSGYRHEFGSLVEAMAASDFVDHPERDLILHLIAAHHGWARPHFEPRAYDREGPLDSHTSQRQPPTTAESQRVAVEMLQRFGRLQQRFGRWGLASLESLLRCADIAASRRVAESTEGRETTETSGLGNPEPARDQAYGATVLSTDTSSPPDARPVICAGGVEEPSFGIEVDVTNPGQFFACCGLLELAHRLWPGAQGWFGNGRFFVAAPFRRDASPLDLLSPLLDCSVEVAKGTQDEKTAPLELGSPILLHLDWWLDGNGKPTPFKTWAANATSRQMFCKWRDPLKESLRAVAGDFLALLQLGTRLQGSYGFDSHLGWDALRVGFSLNEHVGLKDLPTRPVIELVGAIGLQRFLPRLDRKQYEVRYSPWGHPLSAPVARVASIGLVQTNGSRTLRTRFVSRGSFKGLDAASTFQGEFDE
ncbi:MAG: hypothetical protein A3I61_10640 [Acidobacteria bacterium RIFCSPLOWO2_02_FULL_68_18]|nr:MAG: hypothetical protein A3I61_10640 [Acidobacteria bacterium RIFCSPLOWO2_02_FULL_68_18]